MCDKKSRQEDQRRSALQQTFADPYQFGITILPHGEVLRMNGTKRFRLDNIVGAAELVGIVKRKLAAAPDGCFVLFCFVRNCLCS